MTRVVTYHDVINENYLIQGLGPGAGSLLYALYRHGVGFWAYGLTEAKARKLAATMDDKSARISAECLAKVRELRLSLALRGNPRRLIEIKHPADPYV